MGQTQATQATPHDRERHAFNAAFLELDLCWHWDESTYAELQAVAAGSDGERVRRYVESRHRHLLTAYDAEFLVDAICATKSRLSSEVSQGAHARVHG